MRRDKDVAFGGDIRRAVFEAALGKNAETEAGAIYRYFRGELVKLYPRITIPNAICFSPDRKCAYFADTAKAIIWQQDLNGKDGWPKGSPKEFLNFENTDINPDGAEKHWGAFFVDRTPKQVVIDLLSADAE